MKENISVLMDGELFADEADSLLKNIKQDASAQRDWEVYHLIGDVLRQPDHIHSGIKERVVERLQAEPVMLSARRSPRRMQLRTWGASAAAALSAVAMVAWMGLKIAPEAQINQTAEFKPANVQIQSDNSEYVMAHQEFSPGTDMNGVASYIRTVSHSSDEK